MKCPYCDKTKENEAGLSMHVKYMHPEHWEGKLSKSIPSGFVSKPSTNKRVYMKGYKKPPIYSPCPYCSYTTNHPPALSRHIEGAHPEKWKGRLRDSIPPKDKEEKHQIKLAKQREWRRKNRDRINAMHRESYRRKVSLTNILTQPRMKTLEQLKERKREYGRIIRERNRAAGLTSAGKPRKRPVITSRLSHPYVYPVPGPQLDAETPETPKTHIKAVHMKHCPNCGEDLGKYRIEE